MLNQKMLRPDSKGRVTLGELAKGVSGYLVTVQDDHKIVLEPYAEVPMKEKWLFENKEAKEKVLKGLDDAKSGKIIKKSGFAKYLDEGSE